MIRVASFNVKNLNMGSDEESLKKRDYDEIARLLRGYDIVVMQEVLSQKLVEGFMGNNENTFTGENSIYPFITPFILGCIFARYKIFDFWNKIGNNQWTRIYKLVIELWLVIAGYKFYHNISKKVIWEYHYGVYTVFFILMCVDIIMLFPFISRTLNCVGKHSTNIFLIHTLLQLYFKDQLMAPRHFCLITLLWLLISIILSIMIETLKKITRYNKLIDWLSSIIRESLH